MEKLNVAILGIPIPDRMKHLPISENGFPTPWFVAEVNGVRDFRIADNNKMVQAVNYKRCWVCGQTMGSFKAFAIGPMCALNRNTAEPPTHLECAEYSVRACPFLSKPRMRRNKVGMPEESKNPAGIMIERNPGAICIWITKSFRVTRDGDGVLFKLGDPERVMWFAEGRTATRAEVEASIASGLPILKQYAMEDGIEAMKELEQCTARLQSLLPAA